MSDGKLYVLLFSTPLENYEAQRSSYDLVVGTFALQGQKQDNGNSIIDGMMEQINKFFSR